MSNTFEADARALKKTISDAIAAFEAKQPNMAVAMDYDPNGGGLDLTIKPKEILSYRVRAGDTVPLRGRPQPPRNS